MLIFGVITALMCVAVAYVIGERNGDEVGYDRGVIDGRQLARNEASIAIAEAAKHKTPEVAKATEMPNGKADRSKRNTRQR